MQGSPAQTPLQPSHLGFKLLDDVELDALPDSEWTINRMSQTGTLEIIAGPSGSGKTSFAAARACHQAHGGHFLGFDVLKTGSVIYAALEGISAFKKKIRAWKHAHGIDPSERIGVYTINEPVDLLLNATTAKLIEAAKSIDGGVGEFYIDTVARATGGNEDNEDLSRVVEHADMVRHETGARVTLIHHFGKDRTRGSRGGSALPAAADTVLTLERLKERHVLKCDKQRDGVAFDPVYLRLQPTGDTALFTLASGAGQAVPLLETTAVVERAVLAYLATHSGISGSAVAKGVGRNKDRVLTALRALAAAGRVTSRKERRADIWELLS